jgi:O-succinylbenzoate synthase
MRVHRIDLYLAGLPLIQPFQTSSSLKHRIHHILIRLETEQAVGWGECASPEDPYFNGETTVTCFHVLRDFLGPAVLGKSWSSIPDFIRNYRLVKEHAFARAGLEMAAWDALAKARGQSLTHQLGGSRSAIEAGVSLGVESDINRLFDRIEEYLDQGYRRIKLKIAPGRDVSILEDVRERYSDLLLQVDANSAYTLDDAAHLRELDRFGLLLIEQPLEHDDLLDHAALQRTLKTPLCLDESLKTVRHARQALDIDACRVINIKVSRVGGLTEARRMHDLCVARGVPAWCGGMHEFGIGRAANLALASLPGFTLPSDLSGSNKYFSEDLVEPPIHAEAGMVTVPQGPGLGVTICEDRLRRATLKSESLTARALA